MEYITIAQAAEKWGIKSRRVQTLCSSGRIEGARKFGMAWMIPEAAEKPTDARIKNGNYIGYSQRRRKSRADNKIESA